MSEPMLRSIAVRELDPDIFAPFGDVIAALEDGAPFGQGTATLDLSRGTPRFYIMGLSGRGQRFSRITRHRQVTQCLASVGGRPWWIAVAPPFGVDDPEAQPALEDIKAFRIPGDVAIKLHRGTWHAGPFFEGEKMSFFNLELADTNETDHQSCDLAQIHGVTFAFESV
jgi:ureidoglycolate hydrolase